MIKISDKVLGSLKEAARQAAQNAYAPYSNFSVGAALLTEDDVIYVGCNVENASFGLTNCAERTALYSAVADGRGRGDFLALLLYTPSAALHSPCGACRQVLAEFLAAESLVYSTCDTDETLVWHMDELLPDLFEMPVADEV
ncbi:Cytidine deaminase [Pseudodesulfovibrio profundus]|uniref:Cytidine deaminase n=1 Tax=Pseudodesulfovibrio profundus TaxID=57320 RepID=A0A2C8F5X3_9BACT|nr:cytidine deaminase [Pseudodesulfovibrio profundus]SOB57828.1 Cytidine deaminase [Pseudodesulfovibrio profundus]